MLNNFKNYSFEDFKYDFSSSIVVFFVAIPLCLGIALASGAPLLSGIIAGIVGGVFVGLASRSQVGVCGPSAGLAVVVLNAIGALGWETFLLSVMLAGFLQLVMGYLRAGAISYYFPSAVIKGMLAGIGVTIIIKQIPYAVGYVSDLSFSDLFHPAQLMIAIVSLFILIICERPKVKQLKISKWVQGPLLVVIFGVVFSQILKFSGAAWALGQSAIVQIPVSKNISDFLALFTLPDFSSFNDWNVYKHAIILALVATIETLLCVEATDDLDVYNRKTPANRELKVQGIGNMFCGLIGGLPTAQVIIRSSANIRSGAKTQLSTVYHGFLLLLISLGVPQLLNMIPLASLAAILIFVGYKLASIRIFRSMWSLGYTQFLPFVITTAAIVYIDLLYGVIIGVILSSSFTLKKGLKNTCELKVDLENGKEHAKFYLPKNLSFLNKAAVMSDLSKIKPNTKLTIDGQSCSSIDYDILETVQKFCQKANLNNIDVDLKGNVLSDVYPAKSSY